MKYTLNLIINIYGNTLFFYRNPFFSPIRFIERHKHTIHTMHPFLIIPTSLLLSGYYYYKYNFDKSVNYTPYKYYELAIQKWCQDKYQIHGLWPQYDPDTYPTNCPAPSFVNIEDGTLLNEMNAYWHNCDSTQDFWNHEYTKHLSCIYQQYGINEYDSFQLTINLFNELTESDFDKCNNNDDCIVACFDLYLNKINCPT